MLLGGQGSERTSDIVYTNGTVVPGFALQNDVRYVLYCLYLFTTIFLLYKVRCLCL